MLALGACAAMPHADKLLRETLASIAMAQRADQEGTGLGTKKVDLSRCACSQVGSSHSPTKTKLRWGSAAQRAVSGHMAGRRSPNGRQHLQAQHYVCSQELHCTGSREEWVVSRSPWASSTLSADWTSTAAAAGLRQQELTGGLTKGNIQNHFSWPEDEASTCNEQQVFAALPLSLKGPAAEVAREIEYV